MAWFDVASNQMVSFTNAQGCGINLNVGQSHISSSECMTKLDILTLLSVDPTYMSSYALNQLVPKSAWVASLNSAEFTFYYITSGEPVIDPDRTCFTSHGTITLYWSGTLGLGTYLWRNSAMNNPALNGSYRLGSDWFYIHAIGGLGDEGMIEDRGIC